MNAVHSSIDWTMMSGIHSNKMPDNNLIVHILFYPTVEFWQSSNQHIVIIIWKIHWYEFSIFVFIQEISFFIYDIWVDMKFSLSINHLYRQNTCIFGNWKRFKNKCTRMCICIYQMNRLLEKWVLIDGWYGWNSGFKWFHVFGFWGIKFVCDTSD